MIVLTIVAIALAGAITNLVQTYQELRYEERRAEVIKRMQIKNRDCNLG